MTTQINGRQSSNPRCRHRWAVWVGHRKPLIVHSRATAKRSCVKANSVGYFCRWEAGIRPTVDLSNMAISDFIVWQQGSDGHFARHMYLLPQDTLNGLTPTDHARYRRALANPSIWKLGSENLLKAFGEYPTGLVEITWDSDMGMLCAGYCCVGEVSTVAELHTLLGQMDPNVRYYGTVDGADLKIWVEAVED